MGSGQWVNGFNRKHIFDAKSAHEKAEILQNLMLQKLNCFLPEKEVKFTSEDQPWVTTEIKEISRRKKREFSKKRRSPKWKRLDQIFSEKCEIAKSSYYTNMVSDLKTSNPSQWYSKSKRMSSHDQLKSESVNVEQIMHLSAKEQANKIADNFAKVSNEYSPLHSSDIDLTQATNLKSTPVLAEHQVYEYLKRIKTNTATVKDDIPAKVIKEFACELATPVTDIINTMVRLGQYPNIWKVEMVSPVPKIYPPETMNDLRKITGLKNVSKVSEKSFQNG